MLRVLSGWRKPDKQAAYDAALERGEKLGIRSWVLPREQLQLGGRLGAGAFGVVYRCKANGRDAVAKQVAPARLEPKDLPQLQTEMRIWSEIEHPHCVKFHGVVFELTDFYYLLCEFMPGGSLYDRHQKRLASSKSEPPNVTRLLSEMRQIASAVEHLHSKNIIHRDLKSANVLVAGDGRLCVADFGLVRYCESSQEANMTAETGSYRWMAPEVIRHERYGTKCDVYSYAVLCWEILTAQIPFPESTPVEVALSVAIKGLRPSMPSHVPSVISDLVRQCWSAEASQRPCFTKVLSTLDDIEAAQALNQLLAAAPAGASIPQCAATTSGAALCVLGDGSGSGYKRKKLWALEGGDADDRLAANKSEATMKRPKSIDSGLANYSSDALSLS
jgi:serine/threonine protein kinase